ncbi:centrosomal protein of 192 kDa isoform X1 [Aythya fuligula]|uniref:Centrosomal protein of 192 kDa isoform X1 n=1 Tax=Aythya fuligula TaxID=219594 RepID=A0A6J3CKH1_AYTFU|nr:centrosomal protein of 192 kDa isoform X1 [Aythya fuligula]
MEDVRRIADETFPSFLGASLNSSASLALGNVTASSNPGLPVAASTVARSKAGCDDRLSDILASYIEEGKQSPLSQSPHSSQSDPEPMGRFALSFHDDLEVATQVKEPQPASVCLKESCSIYGDQGQSVIEHSNHRQDTLLDLLPLEQLEDLPTGICFLPDIKNNKVGPSEPSEKLAEGETSSDHLSNSLSSFLENEKLSSLASLEGDSTDDDIDDEEFFDNQLEAYFEQLIPPEITRGDINVKKLSECYAALKLSENGLLQEDFRVPDTYPAVTGADSGNASDEDSQNQGITACPEQREMLPRAIRQLNSMTSGDALDSRSAAELRLDSLYLQCMDSHEADVTSALSKQEIQSSSECQAAASDAEVLHPAKAISEPYTTPKIPLSANAPGTADSTECEVGLADAYLSPTADSCENTTLSPADKGDIPHSIVYQNEEGKWVTDLAYYTSFDEEQDLILAEDDKIDEDFITGSEAAAMIAQDQEEFEKEHRLGQAEKVDILNASEVADCSWKSANSCILLRTSELNRDASYLRLSLGEFFGQRSEALGCLGGDSDVKRPSFGYHITSPKKREPVALLRQSDVSGCDTVQETSQLSDVFTEDLETQTKEHGNSTSCESAWHRVDSAAGIQKSINTEAATQSNSKEGIHEDKVEGGLCNHSDSVLSISTIASAIANASCSADPTQLAAMMMALSTKNKKTCFLPGIIKEMELSANHALPNNVESSAFDMEKYLRKTDELGHESEYESIVKHDASVQNFTTDGSLLSKVRNKDAFLEDLLNDHDEQQEVDKRFLDYFHAENDTQNICNPSDVSKHEDRTTNSVKGSEKLTDLLNSKHSQSLSADLTLDTLGICSPTRNDAQRCGTPLSAKIEMSQRNLFAHQTDNLTSRCCTREDAETDQATNAVPEPLNGLERSTGNTVSLSNLKPAKQSGKYVLVSPTKAKPVQKLNTDETKQSPKIEKRNKEASTACSGNVKHVTFEKLSLTSQDSNEHQPVLPECDLQPLEDEQYSFRPSTSPLIHSSPSDASGTAFSGSEADFTCTSHYPKSPCKENTLPQSVYSSPSMSRLTYVSASDSTLKNTAVTHDPQTRWSENASELSTTIIRASPTPSQEHANENVEDYLCQRNRKGVLFNVDEKSEENDLAAIKRKHEDEVQGQELSTEGLPKNEKLLASIPSNVAANHKELDPVKSALSSKFCSFEPLSVNVDAEAWQDPTNKAQRQGLPSLNVLPMFPGLRTYIPLNQNSSGEQYIPISSFKPHVTTSESQAISSVPTLLTGRSLATTPFVQQHLGNMPSTGSTVLSQFHGCSSAGFGLPVGLPCSTLPAGHVENPVPVGIPLGSNLGPGSLGAASLCNPHSASWNKNILNLKSFAGQPLGTGRKEWDFSMSPGLGHVKVPEELKFPNACCVGIASQTALSIFNPTERWLQVSIGILSISVNGEKMDPAKYQCLVFKNKAIIGPHSTDDLKILFLPCHAGIFQCILSVSSWPVSADAETIVQAEALASRVVLTAVAENPHLEVETGEQDYLDFGDLTSGSWKALPLKLTNKTHAFVPIRLIINANAVAWRCFTFSKEPVNPPSEQSLQMDTVSQISAPSVVNHVIHASYDGQDPEALTVWVLFHAPKKQISCSDPLGPADEFLARVDVELDSPGPTGVIKSIPLRARAGTARIHAPKDLQTIHLSTTVGSTAKQQLPLKNAGNIGVYLKVKTSNQDSCFAVEPGDLFLLPEEEREVTVMFFPKTVTSIQSVLKILVLPSGPQYEVVMKGEVENRPASTAASCSDIPPILSNKQFIAWGGVKLGGSVQQKLTLRNNSPSVTQHLRLVIRGQDQDCFQLQSIFGSEERLTSSWELKIRPKEDTNIYLMFTPTRVTYFFAKLEIKQLGIRSRPGIKFTIPLSGYGGTSNIILESVKKLSDSYMLTLDGLLPSRLSTVSFRIRNTGSRAAYVKALCFANLQTKTVMDPQVMTVSPENFVLREGTYEVITVTWNPMEKENNLLRAKTLLSTVCFFCGDEISRQQYRRAMMCELEVAKHIVPENSILRKIVFDEEFQGEQLVTEVCDIPRGTRDIHLFYANMRKVVLTVAGRFVFDRDGFQQSPGRHLESNRSENSVRHINATLDVLPVKGPQGPPLPVKTDDLIQNQVDVQQTWTVKPEHLILTPPSISGTADTGHVQIVNHSNRMLTFELSWPAHCLTITPQHGVIEPESRTLILVSPNPSLATKPSVIPWSGLIYIHCDNGQKFIKVQIQEGNVQDVPGAGSPSRRRDIFALQSASPTVHVAKPLSALPLTKMEIKNRSVLFPETRAGESSESYLEMENKGDENVRWNLSSFTPPYVKGVDRPDSVYRVTYSAFICYRVSGTLEAHGKEKVALIFLPREDGDYSQFWDLECHPVEKPSWKHKLRFQLCGVGIKTENKTAVARATADTIIGTGLPVLPERKVYSEGPTIKAGSCDITRGIYAPENLYTFPLTRVGESRTLKVNLRNNSFRTHLLTFLTPKEPFYIKHSKYSLKSHHYINMPVQFKPPAEGIYEAVLNVHTEKYGFVSIRLCGKAVARD